MKDFFELREGKATKTEDKGQFIYAAKQAKAKGDSTFVFAGKTYNCEEVLENEDLDEAVNMGPWNRGAINKAMGKAGIKGKMAKDFIAALRGSGTFESVNEEFVVKFSKTQRGVMKMAKFDDVEKAKEYLRKVKKMGFKGIVSKNGKPVYSSNDIKESVEQLDELREPFIVYDPENGDEVVGTASDEKGAKAIISSAGRPPMSHPNPKALKIAKSRKKQHIGRKLVEESVDRSDDDWVVVGKGRKPVRFLKNPKNNKAPRNWQKSSDEQEVIRVSKAKQMGIIREANETV